MKDIILSIVIPIITAVLSFIGATYKSKVDLKKQIELNNTELKKVKEQCNNEIEKIKMQMDKQSEVYEKNAQTDIIKDFMSDIMNNPSQGMKKMNDLKGLMEIAASMQNNFGKK